MSKFKVGRWYDAKSQVRGYYREYRKGILRRNAKIGIIFAYRGARRIHYGDKLDHLRGEILYIGEGRQGDQKPTAGNRALVNAVAGKTPIDVFLDCGDVFKPKKLLYAGVWRVISSRYGRRGRSRSRKVYQFRLRPTARDGTILQFLKFTFAAAGANAKFERDLRHFAAVRHHFYSRNGSIIRAHDNVIGEIGEYFAIKEFNKHHTAAPLIRLHSAAKDVDAIQIATGKRIAVKTVGDFPATTSNIWSRDVAKAVDYFLIVWLDRATLQPVLVCQIPAFRAKAFLRRDRYQGSHKISVDERLVSESRLLLDNRTRHRSKGREK